MPELPAEGVTRHRDPAVTSRIMSAVRSKNTQPELMLRRELHRRGLRYRLHVDLPGRPDVVFPRGRLAVFVDGDFWHGHGWRERGFVSFEEQFANHRDPEKWRAKIRRNMERDLQVTVDLEQVGWEVVRILESQIRDDLTGVANGLQDKVGRS